MKTCKISSILLNLPAFLLLAGTAMAQPVVVSDGHTDLEFNYEDDAWEAAVHNEPLGEIEPGDAVLFIANEPYPDGGRLARPPGSEWDFLGVAAGADIWVYSDTAEPGLLAPGFSTEETNPADIATWTPDSSHSLGAAKWIVIALLNLDGPGQMSMWTTDTFGTPTAWMSSTDGITSADAFYIAAGGHVHANWGFTQPGIYSVTMQAMTQLAGGGASFSDPVTFNFGVGAVPEPAAGAALAGLAALGVLAWRRRGYFAS